MKKILLAGLLLTSFLGAKAQTITFTGATTDFTMPGISALAAGTGATTYYACTDDLDSCLFSIPFLSF